LTKIVLKHLNALIGDLDTWRPVTAAHVPLYLAGLGFMKEISTALGWFSITSDADKFNKDLIISAMDFCQRWETWLSKLQHTDLQHRSTKIFHEFLLRYIKGCVKYYRIWRIDRLV
jgi:hypothetical protein